jgi:hypothetical protein
VQVVGKMIHLLHLHFPADLIRACGSLQRLPAGGGQHGARPPQQLRQELQVGGHHLGAACDIQRWQGPQNSGSETMGQYVLQPRPRTQLLQLGVLAATED